MFQGQDTPLSYFIILCKTYKDIETKTNKKGRKAKKPKVQETTKSLDFINVEDEVFLKVRINQGNYEDNNICMCKEIIIEMI